MRLSLNEGPFPIRSDTARVFPIGLFVGSSSALNMVGVVKAARQLGPGHTILTLLPDAGYRHWSSLWSDENEALVNRHFNINMDKLESVFDFVM